MKTILIALVLSLLAGRAVADTKVSATLNVGAPIIVPAPVVVDSEPGRGPPPWAPAHGRRAKFHYQYYPTQQVYYRPADGMWFYLSAGQWRIAASLPTAVTVDVRSGFVPLDMDVEKPFVFHADVVAAYTSTGGKAAAPAVSESNGGGKGKGHGKGKGK